MKPYQSALIPHYELIRELRWKRKTWKEVAEHLSTLGIIMTPSGVYLFFKRNCRKKAPLGFPPLRQEQSINAPVLSAKEKLAALKAQGSEESKSSFKVGNDISK